MNKAKDQSQTCSFCGKIYTTSVCTKCAELFFPVLESLVKKQTNKEDPLQNIENLVFQGGGVRGVCYLGVLEALGDEFLSKVKRIAGSSAGAMCSLYLGLRKDKNELVKLIKDASFKDLLDDGAQLKVHWPWHTLYFSTREVVLASTKLLEIDPEQIKDYEAVKNKMTKIVGNVIFYLSGKGGFLAQAGVGLFLPLIKKWISNWLEKSFSSVLQNDQQQPNQLKASKESFHRDFNEIFDDTVKKAQKEGFKELNEPTEEPRRRYYRN